MEKIGFWDLDYIGMNEKYKEKIYFGFVWIVYCLVNWKIRIELCKLEFVIDLDE